MALNYIEAKNGYPIALLPSAAFTQPRPSEGALLAEDSAIQYSNYIKEIVDTKNARKRRRTVLTVNTGAKVIRTLLEILDFEKGDSLIVLEQQARRAETATSIAQHLGITTESVTVGQGNFLVSPYSQTAELTGNRLDYVVFGLGSPSVDRTRKTRDCRVLAEIIKARELLREGGSLIMAPPKLNELCIDIALGNTRFQIDPEKRPLSIANTRAMRAIALR